MRSIIFASLSLALVTVVGCAGDDNGGPTGDDQNVTATRSSFDCTLKPGEDSSGLADDFKLTLTPTAATTVFDGQTETGKLDPTFKPTTNVDFDRYLVDGLNGDGSSDILVEKKLAKTGKGDVKVEFKFNEGAFSAATYACKAAK